MFTRLRMYVYPSEYFHYILGDDQQFLTSLTKIDFFNSSYLQTEVK